jgi:hypothetical protein
MGYLSESAGKAFKKGTRRAHVPEWFQPLSYVFGGIAALVVVILFLTARDPVSYEVNEPRPAVTNGTDQSTDNSTDQGGGNVTPTAPVEGNTTLTIAGKETTVPAGALDMARKAAAALYTGNYDGVPVYGGGETPPVTIIWENPLIGEVTGAETFPDGSWRFLFAADPDQSGPERTREIMVFVAPDNGGWAYLPG